MHGGPAEEEDLLEKSCANIRMMTKEIYVRLAHRHRALDVASATDEHADPREPRLEHGKFQLVDHGQARAPLQVRRGGATSREGGRGLVDRRFENGHARAGTRGESSCDKADLVVLELENQ